MNCFGVVAKAASLPLGEALLAYSDPDLVKRWQQTTSETLPPPIHLPYPTYDPILKASVSDELAKLDPAYIKRAEAQNALRSALQEAERAARTAVERDFRDRVASGEVLLEGLQFTPSLAAARSVIPSVWAKLLIFMPRNSMWVGNLKTRFIDVTARRTVSLPSTVISSTAPASVASAAAAASLPRPRGRTSYEPLIEAALQANFDKVQQRAANHPEQRPTWTEAAALLHRWLGKEHRNSGRRIPHVQTIRTNLPRIYARLMSEKAAEK